METDLALFFTISWRIWSYGNVIPKEAMESLSEYMQNTVINQTGQVKKVAKWNPPSFRMFKVNIDGAIFKDLGAMIVGMIIRDEKGPLIVPLSNKEQMVHDTESIERIVVIRALSFAKTIGIRGLILGVLLVTMQALRASKPNLSGVWQLIDKAGQNLKDFRVGKLLM
uniref:RNase H type-1 domain-containing protein n=1 Tax=Quercus lobata TaxID=97700 RepID=A0A7N2L9P1_QUELO